ncbi:DUF6318 family protein [Glutamicibacter nicotianae]|uniref:DUF6318 family protein n=1 Tax=Glutamicibacter nicotianae TaxID=37929 RepID=UPI0013CE5C98|nr:DUF6318 family protein [Glutamicibacter nicotianae]
MDTPKIAVVASVAAVALALSGCSTGSAEGSRTSPSAAVKTSPAPDSTTKNPSPMKSNTYKPASPEGPAENVPVPKRPALVNEYSANGAAAFAKYYFELLNYTIETNDAKLISKVTSPDCDVCIESTIDSASRAQKSGKWQVGGKHHLKVLDSYISGKHLAVVTVQYTAEASQFYLVPNKVDSEFYKLEATQAGLGLEFDKQWKIYSIVGDEGR